LARGHGGKLKILGFLLVGSSSLNMATLDFIFQKALGENL
jgi:hypothetical protein